VKYLWQLRGYFRQVAGELVAGSLAGIVMNTAVVLPPILLGAAIDQALALSRGAATRDDVTRAVLLLVGGTLLTEVPRIFKRWWLITANARIRANLRADALRSVLAQPIADLHRMSIGERMARIIGDVEVLGVGVREFTIETWDTVLFSCSFVVAMLLIDAPLALMALTPVPLAMLIAHASGRRISARTTAAREANATLTARIQELLAGFRVLRLYGRGAAATQEVRKVSDGYAQRNLAAARLKLGLPPLYSTLMGSGVILVVWIGGEQVVAGVMSVGALVAFLALFVRFTERGFRIPQLLNSIQSGGAAYARLAPMLAPAVSTRDEPRWSSFSSTRIAGIDQAPPAVLREGSGPIGVALSAVTFSYPGAARPALNEVSLTIEPGSFVAVTGPVGAGKSALARILLDIYPVDAGHLSWRGEDGMPVKDLAGGLGYLPQDPQLFSGTVRDNVLLADAASVSVHLHDALDLACMQMDIDAFGDGVQTQVGELGVRVSGGQRQRIGLARAIAAHGGQLPGLLVLDDPFSAIDVETEARIIAGLRQAFGARAPRDRRATIVLCSQRLAAFAHADRVVVLDAGRIAETGRHEELLAAGGCYARIYRAQAQTGATSTVARDVQVQ
jgi:ABC-type multidrug transport system fused ATPase/permease subunit